MTERSETYDAIRKLLATLNDPFTRFLEPAQYEQLRKGNSGSVTGVGLEVAFSSSPGLPDNTLVVRPPPPCSHLLSAPAALCPRVP